MAVSPSCQAALRQPHLGLDVAEEPGRPAVRWGDSAHLPNTHGRWTERWELCTDRLRSPASQDKRSGWTYEGQ